MTPANPFNSFLMSSKSAAATPTPAPVLVEKLELPIRPLSEFPTEVQGFIRHMIDKEGLVHGERDGETYVSWHDLNPYMPPGADAADWAQARA